MALGVIYFVGVVVGAAVVVVVRTARQTATQIVKSYSAVEFVLFYLSVVHSSKYNGDVPASNVLLAYGSISYNT